MKILYIIALVVTVVFGMVDIYYIEEYQNAYYNEIMNDLYSGGYDSYSYYDSGYERRNITFEAALISVVLIVFYVFLYSFTLAKIKRLTAKVMSIIGLCLSGLMLLLTFIPMSSPGGASWNEFGPVLFLFVLVMLAFCIVNLVQAVRNSSVPASNQGTVDDLI